MCDVARQIGVRDGLPDTFAPDQKTIANVIANFKQVAKDGDLRLHPIVTRLVDKDMLEKMGATASKKEQN